MNRLFIISLLLLFAETASGNECSVLFDLSAKVRDAISVITTVPLEELSASQERDVEKMDDWLSQDLEARRLLNLELNRGRVRSRISAKDIYIVVHQMPFLFEATQHAISRLPSTAKTITLVNAQHPTSKKFKDSFDFSYYSYIGEVEIDVAAERYHLMGGDLGSCLSRAMSSVSAKQSTDTVPTIILHADLIYAGYEKTLSDALATNPNLSELIHLENFRLRGKQLIDRDGKVIARLEVFENERAVVHR